MTEPKKFHDKRDNTARNLKTKQTKNREKKTKQKKTTQKKTKQKMRFNEKELSQVALEGGDRFEREGVLFIRERQETFLDLFIAQPEVFVERWCRLRGNLLFYFKTKDWKATSTADVAGVFVLERFDIQVR